MTRDDIIRMAQEVGINTHHFDVGTNELERFAALVAAAKREECAKVCDTLVSSYQKKDDKYGTESDATFYGASIGAEECASAIRAIGEPL